MRMRAQHRDRAPVQMPAQRDLLARGLRMDLDQRAVRLAFQFLEHRIRPEERTIALQPHERAPQHGEHRQLETLYIQDHVVAPRIALRQVRRPAHRREIVDLVLPAPLVPHMVAQRDRIHPGRQQRFRDGSGDARAGGRVFAVGDHHVQIQLSAKPRQTLLKDLAPRLPHDVSDEQNLYHSLHSEHSRACKPTPK